MDLRGTTSVLHSLLVKSQQPSLKKKLPNILEAQMAALNTQKAVVPKVWMRQLKALAKAKSE